MAETQELGAHRMAQGAREAFPSAARVNGVEDGDVASPAVGQVNYGPLTAVGEHLDGSLFLFVAEHIGTRDIGEFSGGPGAGHFDGGEDDAWLS
jgi:hypothetical protein